jgi:hypothetical protein
LKVMKWTRMRAAEEVQPPPRITQTSRRPRLSLDTATADLTLNGITTLITTVNMLPHRSAALSSPPSLSPGHGSATSPSTRGTYELCMAVPTIALKHGCSDAFIDGTRNERVIRSCCPPTDHCASLLTYYSLIISAPLLGLFVVISLRGLHSYYFSGAFSLSPWSIGLQFCPRRHLGTLLSSVILLP